MPGLVETVITLLSEAYWIDFRICGKIRLNFGGRRRDIGITPHVTFLQHEMEERITVVATKPITPIIAVPPIFALPGLGLDQSIIGSKSQIASI